MSLDFQLSDIPMQMTPHPTTVDHRIMYGIGGDDGICVILIELNFFMGSS